jgi:hypothetical protein
LTPVPAAPKLRAIAVAVAVGLLAVLAAAGPAAAAKKPSCAEQVVADWYDNGRVDYLYPLHCYREAIKSLPPDVKDYSSAKEEIERALQDAANRPPVTKPTELKTKPGTGGTVTDPSPDETDPTGTGTDTNDETSAAAGGGGGGPDTAGPSSVPIPLIVLGGLSVLLLAAGSAGYLARRFGSSGDGDGGEPPAAA